MEYGPTMSVSLIDEETRKMCCLLQWLRNHYTSHTTIQELCVRAPATVPSAVIIVPRGIRRQRNFYTKNSVLAVRASMRIEATQVLS